jgi:hypothetical protein
VKPACGNAIDRERKDMKGTFIRSSVGGPEKGILWND